jgi:hypothetical protein
MKTTRTDKIATTVLACTLTFSGFGGLFASAAPPTRVTRESVSSAGAPALGPVQSGSISANGRYVVFMSTASNLVGVSGSHVYRHDRATGATVLVSVAKSGAPTVSGAFAPSVSADGRFVAFASAGSDLVDDDTNAMTDIFLRDMNSGTTAMVSASQTGAPANHGTLANTLAGKREISDDGRYVVFTSSATNLVETPNNGKQQVYVKDMATGVVTRASVDATGAAGNDNSGTPSLSGNGHAVAFRSEASNFSPLAVSRVSQIFVRDLELGTTTLESLSTAGTVVASKASLSPSISSDGRSVVFETTAQLDPRDRDGMLGGNTGWDVYLRDRAAGATVFASFTTNTFSGTDSRAPSISADGRWVAFHSMDDKFVAGDANGTFDAFLYDRVTQTFSLASQNDAGQQANSASSGVSLSADGRLALFGSSASNLVTTPASSGMQLYARDMRTNEAPVVTIGDDESLLEGVKLSRLASFSDEDASTSWTATVDYGDGSGPAALALAADKTFTLDHLFEPGSYIVTVTVTDDAGASGTDSLALLVTNVAPTVNLGGSAELTFDRTLSRSGTFSDPGTTETYYATVDYGDGSGGRLLALNGNSFVLDHTYGTAGSYSVTVTVTDSEGDSGSATLAVNVRNYSFQWHEPVASSFEVGKLLPVKFSVLRGDGSPSLDTSVRVEVLDASGAVLRSYTYGGSPSSSVVWTSGGYHVNVDTRDFGPGTYTLRVSFSSPTLTGEFSKQGTVADEGENTSNGKGKDKSEKDKSDKDKKEK